MSKDAGRLQVKPPEHLLLFDGVCNLCNGLVQFIIRHDRRKRFTFAPLQSAAGQRILSQLGAGPAPFDSLVYRRRGRILLCSTAALNVARDLGGAWSLAYALIILPRFLRDAAYDLVARRRYRWFGRRATCMLPEAKVLERFLS